MIKIRITSEAFTDLWTEGSSARKCTKGLPSYKNELVSVSLDGDGIVTCLFEDGKEEVTRGYLEFISPLPSHI